MEVIAASLPPSGPKFLWTESYETIEPELLAYLEPLDAYRRVSDSFLRFSELQPDKTYIAARTSGTGSWGEDEDLEDDTARRTKKQKTTEAVNGELVKLLQRAREEMRCLRENEGILQQTVEFLERYQDSGVTRLSAAYAVAELAIDHASSIFRRLVAEDHLKLSFSEHKEEFRRLFYSDYVEEIDYCRVSVWEFNWSGLSLAEYWSRRGVDPESPLCQSWNDPPAESGTCVPGLLEYLHRTEAIVASQLGNGVKQEEVETFLRLYSTAARLDRNKMAHYFSFYDSETRKKKKKKKNLDESVSGWFSDESGSGWFPDESASGWFPSPVESRKRLIAAKRTAYRVFTMDDLKVRLWVMKQLNEEVGFGDHTHVFRAFLRLLLGSMFPELVANALDAATLEQATRFQCVVLEHFTHAHDQGSDWRLPGSVLLVEMLGRLFRYRNSKRSQEQALDEQPGTSHSNHLHGQREDEQGDVAKQNYYLSGEESDGESEGGEPEEWDDRMEEEPPRRRSSGSHSSSSSSRESQPRQSRPSGSSSARASSSEESAARPWRLSGQGVVSWGSSSSEESEPQQRPSSPREPNHENHEDEQWVWEEKIEETWVLNEDAWKLLLGADSAYLF